jgi:hypothetical protein
LIANDLATLNTGGLQSSKQSEKKRYLMSKSFHQVSGRFASLPLRRQSGIGRKHREWISLEAIGKQDGGNATKKKFFSAESIFFFFCSAPFFPLSDNVFARVIASLEHGGKKKPGRWHLDDGQKKPCMY